MTVRRRICFGIILVIVGLSAIAMAGEPEVIIPKADAANDDPSNFTMTPATDIPEKTYEKDARPARYYEIIRTKPEAITIGRLTASCSCLKVTAVKNPVAANERALIEVRVVYPPAENATYMIFAQITSPREELVWAEMPVDRPVENK